MRNQQVFDAIGRKLAKDFPTKPALLLDPELRIRAVTSAYAGATLCERGELLGQFMFDAFPDDPSDPLASGTANLAASFETAMSTRRDHDMWVQRYDIPDPAVPDGFLPRAWRPTNSPLLDQGELVGVLHCVEEITDVAGALALMGRAIQAGEAWPLAELLHAMAAVNIAESVRHSEREQALVAEAEQLRRAVETRDVIGQAKGMVMERFDVDAAAAFDLLKRLSQDTNTPLREVAWKVVAADHSPQSN